MDRNDIIPELIMEMRKENAVQHREIYCKLSELEGGLFEVRLWKAKAMGAVIALSTVVSVTAWTIDKIFGG